MTPAFGKYAPVAGAVQPSGGAREPSQEALQAAVDAVHSLYPHLGFHPLRIALRAAYAVDFGARPPEPGRTARNITNAICIDGPNCPCSDIHLPPDTEQEGDMSHTFNCERERDHDVRIGSIPVCRCADDAVEVLSRAALRVGTRPADDPPIAVCNRCGRKTWSPENLVYCTMTQPDGSECGGSFVRVALRDGAPDTEQGGGRMSAGCRACQEAIAGMSPMAVHTCRGAVQPDGGAPEPSDNAIEAAYRKFYEEWKHRGRDIYPAIGEALQAAYAVDFGARSPEPKGGAPPEGVEPYIWRFICAVAPEAPHLALESFNERGMLEAATEVINELRARSPEPGTPE